MSHPINPDTAVYTITIDGEQKDNVSFEELKQFVEKSSIPVVHLDDVNLYYDGVFDSAVANGYNITEYHTHKRNPNYTVHMEKNGKVATFTNIKSSHLAKALDTTESQLKDSFNHGGKSDTIQSETTARDDIGSGRGVFDSAISQGYKVTEYHSHERNPNYTVHVSKENNESVFTNTSPSHYLKDSSKNPQDNFADKEISSEEYDQKTLGENQDSSPRIRKGVTLKSCIQKGSKLKSVEKNKRDSFSVYLELPDGSEQYFPSVSEEHLREIPNPNHQTA
ncbi:hypothetical protein HK103_001131 [Boothiomyces macroporosus]|uniref:Uncharacterized protein n=1 Tax=Boothiomyces macroporosus TaxID=261099 RepID=A0AAD5UB04_9FUNG|nr:hypothetical protein HK103_001131 [Boothiomyces macroporosus]